MSRALDQLEVSVHTPIVEGETEIWSRNIRDALVALRPAIDRRLQALASAKCAASDGALQSLRDEDERLALQLEQLIVAADALHRRAQQVGPDEKRIGDEVQTFIEQAQQFVIDARKRSHASAGMEASAPPP